MVGHVAGAVSLMMAYLGDQAGVFAAMDGEGPMTLDRLAAEKTGMEPKYLREWLGSIVGGGLCQFRSRGGNFRTDPEQALMFYARGPARLHAGLHSINCGAV